MDRNKEKDGLMKRDHLKFGHVMDTHSYVSYKKMTCLRCHFGINYYYITTCMGLYVMNIYII
jgi:hypothetical protein